MAVVNLIIIFVVFDGMILLGERPRPFQFIANFMCQSHTDVRI